jgi:hypothetical protein
VFNSSLGDGARVVVVVGVVAADSVACGVGGDAGSVATGDGASAPANVAAPSKPGSAIKTAMMTRRALTLNASVFQTLGSIMAHSL